MDTWCAFNNQPFLYTMSILKAKGTNTASLWWGSLWWLCITRAAKKKKRKKKLSLWFHLWLNPAVFTGCHPHLSWPLAADKCGRETAYHGMLRCWSVGFPQCSVCILHAATASIQYLAPGRRGARRWLSASPQTLHMSRGRVLLSIHMHTPHVCSSNVFIFRYHFKLWRGLVLYMQQRLMNA